MTGAVTLDTMIVTTPGVAGGKPRINGTGVTVGRIALLVTDEGRTPQQIADGAYPPLSIGQVYAALAYYYLNQEAMDAVIREDDEAYEADRLRYGRSRQTAG